MQPAPVPIRPEGWEDAAMAEELEREGPDWDPDEVEAPVQAAPGAPTFLPEAFDACTHPLTARPAPRPKAPVNSCA